MEHVAREKRLGVLLPVEFESAGRAVTGVAGNISRRGIYVRTDAEIARGEIVRLAIELPSGVTVRVMACAVHSIEKDTARTLGRCTGIGFRFIDADSPAVRAIADLVAEIAGEVLPPGRDIAEPLRLIAASGDGRLLQRMATVLGENGYAVETASSAFEAYVLCLERKPALIVAGEYMPSLEGPSFAVHFDHEAVAVPVLRLKRPFTEEDLCVQVATALGREVRRSSLRADLHEIPLGALLAFLASGRLTGIVTVNWGDLRAELHVRDGRIVSMVGVGEDEARSCLLDLLDWREGILQFFVCPIVDADQIHCSTELLLLEHARAQDERVHAAIPA